ncbi:MAG: hypothetical protein WC876_03395 [Candidatus Thermoplasmatota archaeon]
MLDWVDANSGPCQIFNSPGHAAMLGIGRLQDELAFLASTCKENGVRFEWAAIKATYAAILGEYAPHPVGRPRKDAIALNRRRPWMYLHRDVLQWINECTEEHGLFSASDPIPHAIEAGLRLLRSADTNDAVRSSRFAFDGVALWAHYIKARGSSAKR